MKNIHKINQNIYITSDEEIKDGDWFLDDNNQISHSYRLSHVKFANPKKIILTDNKDLIKDGVQAIDDEFLEWFVKNPSCEWVEVKKGFEDGTSYGYNFLDYRIIIPKEEPKQETLEEVNFKVLGTKTDTFYNGAKWQQERMYSDEDMQEYAEFCIRCNQNTLPCITAKDWFEQFKNK